MRILVMTDTPANPDSGAAGTEYQTIAALRRLGHEVDDVWADTLGRRIRHGNLHYLLELPLSYRSQMLSHLARRRYDVVHASQPHGWLAARSVRRGRDRPVFVHRSHGFEPRVAAALARWEHLAPPRPLVNRMASAGLASLLSFNDGAITRHADGHIVSSSLCAQFMMQRMQVPAQRIAVIAQATPRLFVERAAGSLSPERLRKLLYVGQFGHFKGATILAGAVQRVVASRPDACLTWVCSAQHHAQAAALLPGHVRERVRFMDWRPQEELLPIYDEHGIFLFPSLFEGFGKVLLEAMARGLAVVTSDEGGAHDLVRTGVNGMRVPVGDAEAVATACLQLQDHPDFAAALGRAARTTAEVHTWDRVARETAAFYERLIQWR